jgi:hypothetical protein
LMQLSVTTKGMGVSARCRGREVYVRMRAAGNAAANEKARAVRRGLPGVVLPTGFEPVCPP